MSELSSLLFVDTDELGRPTGLIASNDEDSLASALMPQEVKDTVLVVADADVSSNYPAWNTVSSVSALGDIAPILTALPEQFDDLSSDVQVISGQVGSLTALGDVSAELLALPSSTSGISSIVYNNSGTWNEASAVSSFSDISSVVYNNSGTWNDASAVSGFSDVSSVVYDNSSSWNEASSVSGFSDVSSVVYDNSGAWNEASAVSGFSDVSSVVYDNSGAWNEASAVSSFSDVSSVVYDNSSSWNEASSVSGFSDVSSVVYDNSSSWNEASSVSGFNDVSSVVYNNSGAWNEASAVSSFSDISSVVYNNSGTWNDASSVSSFSDISSVVYNNSGTWNDASSVSSFSDVSSVVYDNSSSWNEASAVSSFSDISSVVYDNSGTWNEASSVSSFSDISSVVYDNSGTWNDASGVSSFSDISSVVYNNSGTWNDASGVSSFDEVRDTVSDGFSVLSSLSGTMPGIRSGPDVSMASALSAIASRVRIISEPSGTDGGTNNVIQLSGTARIQAQGTLAIAKVNEAGGEVAFLKLQGSGAQENNIAYLSAYTVGLVAPGDIKIGPTGPAALLGSSSINGLYSATQDSSGNWDSSYDYVNTASGNIKDVSAYVNTASGNIADVSTYVNTASGNIADVSTYVNTASGNIKDVSAYVDTASGNIADVSTYVNTASGNIKDVSTYVFDTSSNIKDVSNYVASVSAPVDNFINTSGDLAFLDAVDTAQIASSAVTADKLDDVFADTPGTFTNATVVVDAQGRVTSASTGTGGGGGAGDASAILSNNAGASPVYSVIDAVSNPAANSNTLVYDSGAENFVYRKIPFNIEPGANTVTLTQEDLNFDFGPSATIKGGETLDFSGSLTSSGATKTLLEFDDKSRVALGRNSVPLEISALGESNIRLEDDGTSGAFVLLKGSTPSEGEPSRTRMHFQHADLSADSDSQIDFDTDINLGSTAHLNGNTLGSIHIACKNTQGTSVSGGTPVYITGNIGGSNKIEIGVASASVASSMPAVGILSEDLADNIEGYVDAFGIASKLDTSLFTSGDTLYVAPSGGLTNVRPTAASDLVQNIGIVELSDPSNGKVIVLGPGRTNDIPNSIDSSSVSGLGALALLDTVDTAQIDDDAITQAKIAVTRLWTVPRSTPRRNHHQQDRGRQHNWCQVGR